MLAINKISHMVEMTTNT